MLLSIIISVCVISGWICVYQEDWSSTSGYRDNTAKAKFAQFTDKTIGYSSVANSGSRKGYTKAATLFFVFDWGVSSEISW